MIYAQPQAEHAISVLQVELKGAGDAKWYRRLKIIQLSMSGMKVKKLSHQFDLCRKTVRNNIKAYNQTYNYFHAEYNTLGKKLNNWLMRIETF